MNNDCPIANHVLSRDPPIAPTLRPTWSCVRLAHCDPQETEASVREHNRHYDLSLPVIMDLNQSLARRCQVEVVPSAAVFSAGGELAYRGRIDDRFADIGRDKRPQASRHDLARHWTQSWNIVQ